MCLTRKNIITRPILVQQALGIIGIILKQFNEPFKGPLVFKNHFQILVLLDLLALGRILGWNLSFLLLYGNIEKTSLLFALCYFVAVERVWLDNLFVDCFFVVYSLNHQLDQLRFCVFLHSLSLLNLLLRSSLILLVWYLALTKNRLLGLFDLFL